MSILIKLMINCMLDISNVKYRASQKYYKSPRKLVLLKLNNFKNENRY